jgi:putative transposase
LATWKENPNFGKPRVPHYKEKDGVTIAVFTNQQVRIKDGHICFPKKAGLTCVIKTQAARLQQVRIVPKNGVVFLEIVHTVDVPAADVDPDRMLSIDVGVNNLATCFSTIGEQPFIINGKPLKAINQFFNKQKAKLMSYIGGKGTSKRIEKLTHDRNMKVSDYLHNTSATIRDYCIEYRIGTVVIGKNDGWKQRVNIGKVNNQKFVTIPHDTLVRQLQYKLGDIGITVIVQEERYTSKIDHFAFESMEHHDRYQGKRVKRGLFQSSTGTCVNSDVNGAIGILRKVIGDDPLRGLFDRGCVLQPVKMNIF